MASQPLHAPNLTRGARLAGPYTQIFGGLTPSVATTISPSGLSHTRTLGSPSVNPTLAPTGQVHTRAQGAPVVTATTPNADLIVRAKLRPEVRAVRASRIVTPTIMPPVTLSPTGLSHTRAQGAPVVNPQVKPTGLSHTRTLGSPQVNPTVTPSGQAHTRALGAPNVGVVSTNADLIVRAEAPLPTRRPIGPVSQIIAGFGVAPVVPPSPAGLTHTRVLGSPTVSPTLAPSGQTHTRTLGSPTVSTDVTLSPSGLSHTRAQGAPGVSVGTTAFPASLSHTRVLGTAKVLNKVLPSGMSRTETFPGSGIFPPLDPGTGIRALGTITVGLAKVRQLGEGLIVTVAWIPRPTGLSHTRALGSPVAHGKFTLAPASLSHTRAQGAPKLSGRTTPASITHTRALGQASVNVKTLTPASITHTRTQGAPVVTVAWIPRPLSLTHTRALGSTTIRGKLTVTPTSLSHTRAQGAPTLSGRTTPASLVHSRAIGQPAVNVIHVAPLALARA